MQTVAVPVHRAEVPVKRGLVAFRPTLLCGGSAALENVRELLLARPAAKNGLSQRNLRRHAPAAGQARRDHEEDGRGDAEVRVSYEDGACAGLSCALMAHD